LWGKLQFDSVPIALAVSLAKGEETTIYGVDTYWLSYALYAVISMKLDKLFGSKAKADILKYLVFRRQGISIRAFEGELEWSFPAIKKQIDQLEDAGVVEIKKDSAKRSIYLTKGFGEHIKELFIYTLQHDLRSYFGTQWGMIEKFFWGKLFGVQLEMDLVLIYQPEAQVHLDAIKEEINNIFRVYLIEYVSVVFMTVPDFEKRYRLADKFVLHLMRQTKTSEV
jgi:DNA-binding MarR family transcriptional regulator